ncbi:MAG: hypothetical protein AAFX06_00675 [Planctomycetota bacterium]
MKRFKYLLFVVLLVLLLAIPAGIAFMAADAPPPPTPLPNPNGYDTLVDASEKYVDYSEDIDQVGDVETLKMWVETNSEALRLVDEACGQEIVVPPTKLDVHAERRLGLVNCLSLIRLVKTQARVAELEDRLSDAAEIYAKMFDLSNRVDDGGFLMDALLSCAGKKMALDALVQIEASMPQQARLNLAAALEASGNDRIDFDVVMERERAAQRQQFGFLNVSIMNFTNPIQTANYAAKDDEVAELYDKLMKRLAQPTSNQDDGSSE